MSDLLTLASGQWLDDITRDSASSVPRTDAAGHGLQHPHLVSTVMQNLICCMSDDSRQALLQVCAKLTTIRMGTACSGTDIVVVAAKRLVATLKELFGLPDAFNVEHVWSCEVDPFKEQFIRQNCAPRAFFRDVTQLNSSTAFNVMTGREEEIPPVDLF
eukprot:5871698-Pyramimonas_sp.AAC.1